MGLSMRRIVKLVLVYEEKKKLGKNFLFSPLSLTTLLCMVASGLKGEALEKMMFLLGLESVADLITVSSRLMPMAFSQNANGPVRFSSANGAWMDQKYTLKPSFQILLKTRFNAKSSTLDFGNKLIEAIDEINSWGENATKVLIKDGVPGYPKRNDTLLILANALYFKATWELPFDPFNTFTDDFYTLDGENIAVPYMSETCKEFSYVSSQGLEILKLPYKRSGEMGNKFSMYFFLPRKKIGLLDLLQRLNSDSSLISLQFRFKTVHAATLIIPKFKFSSSFEASEVMEQMGLRINIKDTKMVEDLNPDAVVEEMQICQTCCIEVDERGTETAAVSFIAGYHLPPGPDLPPGQEFIADHPFAFMIREDSSETPIFIGVVVNPLLG